MEKESKEENQGQVLEAKRSMHITFSLLIEIVQETLWCSTISVNISIERYLLQRSELENEDRLSLWLAV